MKIQVVTIGEPKLSFAQEGIAEYTKRASRFMDLKFVHIKETKNLEKNVEKALDGTHVILMDENGKEYSSHTLAKKIETLEQSAPVLTLFIGGPDGHNSEMRAKYTETISLSKLTLPHDLAMLFAAEAMYRALSIINGHPYHRD